MNNRLFIICCSLTFTITLFLTNVSFGASELNDYLYPLETKTISMDFRDAELNNVLKIFSQQSGMNFIASSDVADKTINLYLDNVPVEEALERILFAHDLTYEIKSGSNIFLVKELVKPDKELITRVYPLKHATVPSSKLLSALKGEDEVSSEEEGETESGIIGAIEEILSADGSVTEDPRTNSLIVTDIASVFPSIENTIARLDVRVPQILIEVEMLDISKITGEEIGAKWGNTPFTFQGAERDDLFPFNLDNVTDDNVVAHLPGAKDDLFADSRYRVSTVSFGGLAVTLQFLKTKTDTRNLARPRILTLNNETAEIEISTDEAIGLATTTTSAEGLGASTASAERVQTGVFLKVTPQANLQSREITMAIEPRVIQATSGGTFSGNTFRDPEERGAKTILRVKDGDTIIIGGLIRTDSTKIKTTVPILGSIPILGSAFRHKDNDDTERELVIFITPHIVRETLASQSSARETNRLIREQYFPKKKMNEIEQELSYFEKRRF